MEKRRRCGAVLTFWIIQQKENFSNPYLNGLRELLHLYLPYLKRIIKN